MKTARMINGLMWLANAALIVTIVVFVFGSLLFAEESGLLDRVRWMRTDDLRGSGGAPGRTDVTALRDVPNPLQPSTGESPVVSSLPPGIDLIGTLPSRNPGEGMAILRISSRDDQVAAYCGEEIRTEGEIVPELRGWRLFRVTRDSALLKAGGKEWTLRIRGGLLESRGPAGTPGGADFDSELLHQSESRVSWLVKRGDAERAAGSLDAILEDLQLASYPSGGVKIQNVAPSSVAAAHGLRSGDVVKSINGIPLRDVAAVAKLRDSDQLRRAGVLRMQVQRSGRAILFEFRLDAR